MEDMEHESDNDSGDENVSEEEEGASESGEQEAGSGGEDEGDSDDDSKEMEADRNSTEDEEEEEKENESESENEDSCGEENVGEVTGEKVSDSEEVKVGGNAGWADAMSKVLAMGKNSAKPVTLLSKAKRDSEMASSRKKKAKRKEAEKVEVVGVAGQPQEAESSSDEEDSEDNAPTVHIPTSVRRAKKKEMDSVGRVMPDITQRAAEKALVRIATRGVVQLFNAVREQQKSLRSRLKEAGSSRKREKVLKSLDKDGFLDLLEGKPTRQHKQQQQQPGPAAKKPKLEVKKEEAADDDDDDDGQATWNALRDDFMLDAKMRDWDKEEEHIEQG